MIEYSIDHAPILEVRSAIRGEAEEERKIIIFSPFD